MVSTTDTITRPGTHGTLYLYHIEYRDNDPGCPVFHWSTWAYNSEHALERFAESGDDGWQIISWCRVTGAPAHRRFKHKGKHL